MSCQKYISERCLQNLEQILKIGDFFVCSKFGPIKNIKQIHLFQIIKITVTCVTGIKISRKCTSQDIASLQHYINFHCIGKNLFAQKF